MRTPIPVKLAGFFLALAASLPACAQSVGFDFVGTVYGSNVTYLNGMTVSGFMSVDLSSPSAQLTDGSTINENFYATSAPNPSPIHGILTFADGSMIAVKNGDALNEGVLVAYRNYGAYNNGFGIAGTSYSNSGDSYEIALVVSDDLGSGSSIFSIQSADLSIDQAVNWFALGSSRSGFFDSIVGANEVSGNFSLDSVSAVAAVPESSTYALMLAGLGALGLCLRGRRVGS